MGYNFSQNWFEANRWQFEKHLTSFEAKRILEIGSFEGNSTCWLLERFPDAEIICVDTHQQPDFWSNVAQAGGINRVSLRIGTSRTVLPTLPSDAFDFVYIDGSHSTVDVLEDAVRAFRVAKIGAMIAFDDYLWDDPRHNDGGTPKVAIDSFLKIYGRKVELLSKNYQVWIMKTAN